MIYRRAIPKLSRTVCGTPAPRDARGGDPACVAHATSDHCKPNRRRNRYERRRRAVGPHAPPTPHPSQRRKGARPVIAGNEVGEDNARRHRDRDRRWLVGSARPDAQLSARVVSPAPRSSGPGQGTRMPVTGRHPGERNTRRHRHRHGRDLFCSGRTVAQLPIFVGSPAPRVPSRGNPATEIPPSRHIRERQATRLGCLEWSGPRYGASIAELSK